MSFFSTHIFCCTNTREPNHRRGSCGAKGSDELRAYMKSKAKEIGLENSRINSAGCLDQCEQGPCIVVYPQGTWYHCSTKEDVDTILTAVKNGETVKALELTPKTSA